MQRFFRRRRFISGWCFLALSFAIVASHAVVAASSDSFILDLPDGGVLPGSFAVVEAIDGETRQTVPWKSSSFAGPFEFRLDAITGIRAMTTSKPDDKPSGFRCRLRGGDIIDGSLNAIDAESITLVPEGSHEAVRIDRRIVSSVRRHGGGQGTGYVGPDSLVGWEQSPPDSWRHDAARLSCSVHHASITRDVSSPARARYDITLSWREIPELVIALAAGDSVADEPYRFEWIRSPAGERPGFIIRQSKDASSLEEVITASPATNRIRVSFFVDGKAGRLAMALEGSDRIIETTIPPDDPAAPSGRFRLRLLSGDVCLESLRVSEWTTVNPIVEVAAETKIVVRDGGGKTGDVRSLDSASGTVMIAGKEGETPVPLDTIDAIDFPIEPAGSGREESVGRTGMIRVTGHDGIVVSGDLSSVTDSAIRITSRGIQGLIEIPLATISGIVPLAASPPPPLPSRAGTLAIGDARLPGCLVDGAAWGGGLAWLPKGSLTASGFSDAPAGTLSAVVEYVPDATRPKEMQGRSDGVKRKGLDDFGDGKVEIGSLGVWTQVGDNGTFIVSRVLKNGAAARDGRILPGDRILAVRPNKQGPFIETKGLELQAVRNLLHGRVGTSVGVQLETPGEKPRSVDLVRGLILIADREILEQILASHSREGAPGPAVEGDAGPSVEEKAAYPAIVALVSGDLVPAAIERIDGKGVWLRSPVAPESEREAVAVDGHLVKAIELDPKASPTRIPRDRFERLLTVPRSQQSDPPTHLLRLRSGDYLRGKLMALDEAHATFEVVGQEKKLARDEAVHLIWLHPDDLVAGDERPDAKVAPVEPTAGSLLVQGLASGGQRTTIAAECVQGSSIAGRSPAFGPARFDTNLVDRVLLGGAIAGSNDDLPFAKWRLRVAPLPRALRPN